MVRAGILASSLGTVRLLKPNELPSGQEPATSTCFTAWATAYDVIRVLETDGEGTAATLVAKFGARAKVARELWYRL